MKALVNDEKPKTLNKFGHDPKLTYLYLIIKRKKKRER